MVNWYSFYRSNGPNLNNRLNEFVGDFRIGKSLTRSIFDNPLKHATDAVITITANFPGPYSLMGSGGIDSQAMIYAWERSGVPYTIYHYTYDDLNDKDTQAIRKFVEKLGIESKIIYQNFKVLDFLESTQLTDLAKEIDCVSPQILTHCSLIAKTPGTVVLSGNFLNGYNAYINYSIHGLQRYTERVKNNVVPFFFLQTPELAYSFYNIGKNIIVGADKPDYMTPDYYLRWKTYQGAHFKVYPQTNKKTGFEKIKDLYDSAKVEGKLKLKYGNMPSQRPFDYLFRYRLFETVGYYSNHSIFVYDNIINT